MEEIAGHATVVVFASEEFKLALLKRNPPERGLVWGALDRLRVAKELTVVQLDHPDGIDAVVREWCSTQPRHFCHCGSPIEDWNHQVRRNMAGAHFVLEHYEPDQVLIFLMKGGAIPGYLKVPLSSASRQSRGRMRIDIIEGE